MDTEAIAIADVKLAIAKTGYLVDYINDKDKEPMWDGSIYAYSSTNNKNGNWIGKAPVQVKGKNVKNLNLAEIKYDVEVIDLKNYKKDGGVLFFVVAIDNEANTKIFYRAFTPYVLHKLLEDKESQKTIRLTFFSFPTKSNMISNVVIDFIRDAKNQTLFTNSEIPTLEQFLKEAGKNVEFGLKYSGIGFDNSNIFDALVGREVYMYATNTKLNIKFPVNHLFQIEKTGRSIDGCVRIKDKIFYDEYDLFSKKSGWEINIGKSFVFDIDKNDSKLTVHYTLQGNIKERIKDIEFLLVLLRERVVNVDGLDLPINPTTEEIESLDLKSNSEYQKSLIEVDAMLNSFGVEKALEIKEITPSEEKNLNMLMRAYREKQAISINQEKVPSIAQMKIGNIHLLLAFEKQSEETYIIENIVNTQMDVTARNSKGKTFKTSKYVILKAEDILKMDNCSCKNIVDDLVSIDNEEHYLNSNIVLLEIIKAYDICNDSNVLDEAIRLAKWLMDKACLEDISLLNYYQCLRRRGPLSDSQEDQLITFIEKYRDNDQLKAGAYILLDDHRMARKCIQCLDADSQELFETFPIYKLMD